MFNTVGIHLWPSHLAFEKTQTTFFSAVIGNLSLFWQVLNTPHPWAAVAEMNPADTCHNLKKFHVCHRSIFHVVDWWDEYITTVCTDKSIIILKKISAGEQRFIPCS